MDNLGQNFEGKGPKTRQTLAALPPSSAQKWFDNLVAANNIQNLSLEPKIIVPVSLGGHLDLSVLEGCNCLKSIVFQKEGSILSIRNIPKTIVELEITNQQLQSFVGELPNLEYLNLQYNYLEFIDVSKCSNLKILNVSNNNFKDFEAHKLPSSIEELYCSHNSIIELNLINLILLHTLVITNNNANVLIQNIPPNIVRFDTESTSHIINNNRAIQIKKYETQNEVNNAIDQFFILKSQYDEQAKQQKIKKKKCVLCNRIGGTQFSIKKDYYEAYCKSEIPCSLLIKIRRGKSVELSEYLEIQKKLLEEAKTRAITLSLDTAFQYISLQQSINSFNTLEETINKIEKKCIEIEEKLVKLSKQGDIDDLTTKIQIHREQLKQMFSEYRAADGTPTPTPTPNLSEIIQFQKDYIDLLKQLSKKQPYKRELEKVTKVYKFGKNEVSLQRSFLRFIKETNYEYIQEPAVIHYNIYT